MSLFTPLVKPIKKYNKFMTIELNKQGFSRVYFNLSKKRIFTLELLEKIINKVFKKFRKGSTFYLLAKFKFTDNSYRTLHNGIVAQRQLNEDYFIFLKNRIDSKGEEYNEALIKQIIFEYYFIPKSNLDNYILSWPKNVDEIKDDNLNKYIPKDEFFFDNFWRLY
jgi:hypothetical protein